MRRKVLTVILLIILFISCELGNEAPLSRPLLKRPISSEVKTMIPLVSAFEKHFEDSFDRYDCLGAAVVIVKDKSIVYAKGFGVRDAAKEETIDTKSLFRIASLSKGFSSILTGIFVNRGHFDWEDTVSECLPQYQLGMPLSEGPALKIKNLLSHTTGLPRQAYSNLIESDMPLEGILEQLSDVPLVSAVGSQYNYQNAAFAAIEKIIESSASEGQDSFETILKRELFDPLGMEQASANYYDIVTAANVAFPHRFNYRKGSYLRRAITKRYYNTKSAGGINASIEDMGQWLKLLMGNYPWIIAEGSLDYIFAPQTSTQHERTSYNRWEGVKDSNYALGWRVIEFENRQLIYHGGYVNDYKGQIAFDRKEKLGICVLFNSACGYASTVIPSFFELSKEYPPFCHE